MKELSIKLDIFEGPLDLLLHLIQSLEIDIYDIPIAQVTDQYMKFIETMQTLQLEVAGDYLVMAETLMALKSQMLLPTEEVYLEEGDYYEEDPRDQLVAQLLEYRRFKYAAGVLKEQEKQRQAYYTKPSQDLNFLLDEVVPLEPNQVNTFDLFMAFHEVLYKKNKQKKRKTTIQTEQVTIEAQMRLIETKLTQVGTGGCAFDSLLEQGSREEVVTTFLALLELIKAGQVVARQHHSCGPILLFSRQTLDIEEEVV